MKLGFKFSWYPQNAYQWVYSVSGLSATILWASQVTWGWFGGGSVTAEMIFSFIVLILLSFAIGYLLESRYKPRSHTGALKRSLGVFMTILVIYVLAGAISMGMDTTYTNMADDSGISFLYSFRYLSNVSATDVNTLAEWGLGLKTIIKALFLVVPFLVAVWGGLSVLTADSIDEAEGGILAIVASFVVAIVVFIFDLVGIVLA